MAPRQKNKKIDLTFDCVLIVDTQLSASAERRLFLMLDTHVEASISTAILALRPALPNASWLLSDAAQKRLLEGRFAWLDPSVPCHARMAIVLSPVFALFAQDQACLLEAENVLIWPLEAAMDHAPLALPTIREQWRRIKAILNAPTSWVARTDIEQRFLHRKLAESYVDQEVWSPLIARRPAKAKAPSERRQLVGRHWGQNPALDEAAKRAWQEAFQEAWPLSFALLGQQGFLDSLPPVPPDQSMRYDNPDSRDIASFLHHLDVFVAIGECTKPQRFREEILEAIAAGLPVIATGDSNGLLDGGLPSTEPCFLVDLARHLLSNTEAYDMACQSQADIFSKHHCPDAHLKRITSRLGHTRQHRSIAWSGNTRHRGHVIFLSDDSPYLEHLQRQIAVATNLPPPLEPYFLTLSKDASLAERQGLPVEYLLAHTSSLHRRKVGDTRAWNEALAEHLNELVSFLDAKAIVFDGPYPFAGLRAICRTQHALPSLWIRRGLWKADADTAALDQSSLFDLIIEPGEWANARDRGPTAASRDRVMTTEPILQGKSNIQSQSRTDLGMAVNDVSVLLTSTVPEKSQKSAAIVELLELLEEAGCRFWSVVSPSGQSSDSWPIATRSLDSHLAAKRQLSAFDLVISGADYQSFHDIIAARCPAVFLADASKPTDDQLTRAASADRSGWAINLNPSDIYSARTAAKRLSDTRERRQMAELCPKPSPTCGAREAAQAISHLVYSLDLTPRSSWRP